MKPVLSCFAILLVVCAASAQQPVAQPSGNIPAQSQTGVAMAQSPLLLSQLEQTTRNASDDITRLRIDKWKTDGNTKNDANARVQSIQRNITNALPLLLNEARQNPDSLAVTFKLYRNVKALYDEFATLSEYAGAFGGKDDYRLLGGDAQNLDTLSRTLADRMQAMAGNADTQITQLRAQAAQTRAQAPSQPKKIIVDDTAPPKKTTKKKSAAKPKTTPTPE